MTYDAQCSHCKVLKEIQVPYNSEFPVLRCTCGGIYRKKFTAPAIHFKGSGFYSTDSRK